jgi:hypothetical protein
MIKIWVDDVRSMPKGYDIWLRSVIDVKHYIHSLSPHTEFMLDLDHDAGDYTKLGGDYIKILDWCEREGLNPVVRIHSMNPVGVSKMRQIISHNHWKEEK